MVQHCADSWRNVISSTGIMALLTFFDSQDDLKDSDEERQGFAKYYLEDLRFLYKELSDPDMRVIKSECPARRCV